MFRSKSTCAAIIAALILPIVSFAQSAKEPVKVFKEEGMKRSQAMKTMRYLTDVIGSRLTNSPAQRLANRWTKTQFEKWGLVNAKIDPWGEFGRSWELKKFAAHIVSPKYKAIRAYPKAWSPSTNGAITGNVVYVDAKNEAGLEKYKGKLKGAIILAAPTRRVSPGFSAVAGRHNEKSLLGLEHALPPKPRRRRAATAAQTAARKFQARKIQFYFDEGAAVLLDPSFGVDSGTLRVMGANVAPNDNDGVFSRGRVRSYAKGSTTIPQIVVEVEQYNRMVRLAKRGISQKMQVDLQVNWDDSDLNAYNTIAEIPGTDLKDEVVMIGAHMDSWHAGTGATDNGAGTTVVMEAMRILAASGLKPRRTIRVALWTGEEQGLLGSRAYVAKTFGKRNQDGSLSKTAAYDKFAAYYNLDNGTGQIRGIYAQGNANARPIFRKWLAPFKRYGAQTTTINNTGGTDHLAFDAIGLPGFQFIQDRIEYFGRTWHTSQDVSDRTIEKDLKRSAIIMATFAYNSAMTNRKMPKKNQENAVASFLSVSKYRDMMDEVAFHDSGLEFSICGHDVEAEEIPQGFPKAFAVKTSENYLQTGE